MMGLSQMTGMFERDVNMMANQSPAFQQIIVHKTRQPLEKINRTLVRL